MTTAAQIANNIISLQESFGKLERMNPTGDLANKLRAAIDKVDNAEALRLIYAANIKWVSSLALTRLILRGERVS